MIHSRLSLGRAVRGLVVALVALAALGPASAQRLAPRIVSAGDQSARATALGQAPASEFAVTLPAWMHKLDAAGRALALGGVSSVGGSGIATTRSAAGDALVNLFVQTTAPDALRGLPGVEVRAVAGDIAVVRAPVGALEAMARSGAVRFIEVPQMRERFNDTGRADIRADIVQAGGGGLPRAYNGENVVVGVIDSGLDVTHPDFFNGGGSRVQFLLEFLQGGGQAVYTKAQIDANPAAIPQRDGTGGSGHGTHVTGSAAGGGTLNPALRGVAPASDIVFVKGIRHPDSQGGFDPADYTVGADFIFQRAAQLGRPAVINMSLGGQSGPHDGTLLEEQALTNLTGPGRIIVAAAGNDGFKFIHAGENVPGGVENETVVLPQNPDQASAQLWYDAGTQTQFAIGAYAVNASGGLDFLGLMGVNAGQVLGNNGNPVPFVVNGFQLGSVYIDATTTADPRNGDGMVQFFIVGGGGIDIRNVVWSVIATGPQSGRNDLWAFGAEFFSGTGVIGGGVNEVPGNTDMTTGSPSNGLGLIAVGSHVTNNDWIDSFGNPQQWLNPHPSRDPNAPPVVPTLGQQSYFSSRGPTRDGRVSPDVTAPGEYIFSPLSSHVVVGQGGVTPTSMLQGGGYHGLQGTSMASPHVAGTVALMLQADPSLTPAEARQILQETARADGFTGGVPNNNFGRGKIDALAAVLRTIELCGTSCGTTNPPPSTFTEAEPNNTIAQAQSIGGASPLTVNGQAESTDTGALTVNYGGGVTDDFEDLFRFTTTGPGLQLTLGGFNQDLDLFLLNAAGTQILFASNAIGNTGTETINEAGLPAGSYLVGVSFYDGSGETGQSAYSLVATGAFAVDDEDAPDADALALLPSRPNPTAGAAEITFRLPSPQDAQVAVFDVLGREVLHVTDGLRAAGLHRVVLDARQLGAGVYVVRLVAGTEVRTQTLVVAR